MPDAGTTDHTWKLDVHTGLCYLIHNVQLAGHRYAIGRNIMQKRLFILLILAVVSIAISGSGPVVNHTVPQGTIQGYAAEAYLSCALSGASPLQACGCDVFGGEFCRCGTCCESWRHDSCVKYSWYDRPQGYPVCTDYCGYYTIVCIDCGCDLGGDPP